MYKINFNKIVKEAKENDYSLVEFIINETGNLYNGCIFYIQIFENCVMLLDKNMNFDGNFNHIFYTNKKYSNNEFAKWLYECCNIPNKDMDICVHTYMFGGETDCFDFSVKKHIFKYM